MTNQKERGRLEMEKCKLELFKDWGRIIKVSITVLFVCVIIGCKNKTMKKRHLDHQRFQNEADRNVQQKSDSEKREVGNLRTESTHSEAVLIPLSNKSELYLSYQKAQRILDRYKPRNYIDNKFEDKLINSDKVVIDKATGLMWQQSGSEEKVEYNQIKRYLDNLNNEQFAGYSDWRLPTLDESVSLLEQARMHGDLYINPVFNKNQSLVWTSDLKSSRIAWVVHFSSGSCSLSNFLDTLYVRAVR